jgi:hypothetical protein
MTDLELLAGLIDDLLRDLQPEIEPLTPHDLAWQPGPRANSIGVTVWHIARGLDFLATRVLQGLPSELEQWHARGWLEKTGYDPRGKGYGGWGVLTGYSREDVLEIPTLTSHDLLAYLEQACHAASSQVRMLVPEKAFQPVPGLMSGKLTFFMWIKEFYKGFQAHVGEIVAIKALQAQTNLLQ